ncbi:hypothetical protein [Cognatilysobacter bugurensis]|uniref:Uncharacterized protein n=1 Tax=Cognatilysobacter bugurensis TaxID=543356 RepID=A0A918WA68_9GAMM|nr:hypothetical protein [Lysobacter bugurensis]GHA84059.1 hypothetical protein GCM10007067_22810 [Lysobacter bugurensis]
MLGFAKAQSLEAALADAPTPATEKLSTLGLLWGVVRAHARAHRSDEGIAFEAAKKMLAGMRNGSDALRTLVAHLADEQFQAWAELGEMAVERSAEVNDPMPALLDLAATYRESRCGEVTQAREFMPMPGAQVLAACGAVSPLAEWDPPSKLKH